MNLCWISFICYLGAISFQLAGAVLLLVQYCFKSIESQLKSIAVKRTHLDGSVLYLGETKPNDCELVEEIWSNRLAFLYIALGYFVSIFGDPLDINKLLIALIIAVISSVLVFAGHKFAKWSSRKYHKTVTHH
mgnify:CR=1 FL=1